MEQPEVRFGSGVGGGASARRSGMMRARGKLRLGRWPLVVAVVSLFAPAASHAVSCSGVIEAVIVLPKSGGVPSNGNVFIRWRDDANPEVPVGLGLCNLENAETNTHGISLAMCKTIYYTALAASISGTTVGLFYSPTVPEDPITGNGDGEVTDCSEVKQWQFHEEFKLLQVGE